MEAMPMELARTITEELTIPTIGIGAGPHCDGQILVLHDVIGLFDKFLPKFVKKYANLKEETLNAVRTYREEIEKGVFPSENESFK
jgi:3-methyl-2-oxobutanoate hydroxymethyltransferase